MTTTTTPTTPTTLTRTCCGLHGALALSILLALGACDPGPPPGPAPGPATTDSGTVGYPTFDQGAPGPSLDGGVAPQADGVPAPAADSGPSQSCPKVDGRFEGTLQGKLSGFFTMNVTGTLWMELKAGAKPGDYDITGGEMASWAVGLQAFTFKQKVAGSVSCGVLSGSGQANIFGTVSKGTTKCTFDAAGTTCTGTWTGNSTDGKTSGSGTFVVKRKAS